MDMEGLSVICAGLGSIEEDESGNQIGYTNGEHCLDNLKDLLRFLRRDDPHTRDVFKQACKWNIVAKDLIPIIQFHHDDRNLVLNAVKVLVFLTMPMEASSKDANQQLEYLWGLKSAVTHSNTIAVIMSLLEKPLENLECDAFTEDDWKLVQLLLTLFRNLLAVQDISAQQKANRSVNHFLSLRDSFLELLFRENVMDLIIILTQHIGDHRSYLRQDNLLLLETFNYIFMGQDPELIAKICPTASKVEGDAEACLESLRSLMEKEEEKKRQMRSHALSRHSQFSGTFMRFTMDGSIALYKGTPVPAPCDSQLKSHNALYGPVKKGVLEHRRLPTVKKNILDLLYDFVNQFLSGGYNVLMQSILDDIEKECHAIQDSDVLVFFQLAQFAASFQFHRCLTIKPNVESGGCPASTDDNDKSFKGNICEPIAASMNESMFQLVIEKWRFAFEGLKEMKSYKFLSAAGSLMKIMLQMLDLVVKLMPEDSTETETACIILYKLFYDQTDQGLTQLILNLLKSFDSLKQTKSDLANLVEMLFLVVGLMETLQAHGTLRVSRKARKRRKKNKMDHMTKATNEAVADQETAEKENCITGHEQCLESADIGVQVQEGNVANMSSSGKKERSSIPFPVGEIKSSGVESFDHENAESELPGMDSKELNNNNINDMHVPVDDDSSSDEQLPLTDEVDFKINTLLAPLVSSSIINKVCWLLKFYKSNSASTNHSVISILKRICDDMNFTPVLYQLSYLCIFYDILDEQKSCPCKEHEDITNFLTTLVRRMLQKMKSQPLLFVEVLFPKSRRDCHFIDVESMNHELGSMKAEVRNWRYNSDYSDPGLSQGKDDIRRSMADALGDDEYDVVMPDKRGFEKDEDPENLDKKDVFQVRIEHAGKSKGGAESIKGGCSRSGEHPGKEDPVVVTKKKRRLVLNDEVEEKVRGLFEKYKENRHYSRLIAEDLDLDQSISPAQVSNLCRKLGLKVPLRRKKSDADNVFLKGNNKCSGFDGVKDAGLSDSNNLEETCSSRRPLLSRKRVRAFDKNQEQMIRNLFEQFKDHKKCSYMIANALNPDGKVTAVQVSRKLKQLGLRSAQAKRRKPGTLLRDEELDHEQMDEDPEDDNLTLSSLRKRICRSKTKGNAILPSKEASNLNSDGEHAAHDSDEELLTSVLKKSREIQSTRKEKLPSTLIHHSVPLNESKNGVTQGSGERDGKDATESSGDGGTALGHASPSGYSEHEATGIDSGEYNDFTDWEDEIAPSLLQPENFTSKRRKLRIVDLEDDDE